MHLDRKFYDEAYVAKKIDQNDMGLPILTNTIGHQYIDSLIIAVKHLDKELYNHITLLAKRDKEIKKLRKKLKTG